jgi:outer membrane protein assembly factor BamD
MKTLQSWHLRSGLPRSRWWLWCTALFLSGCSLLSPEKINPAEDLDKLYAEAKSDIASGTFDRAIKTLEKIDARATGTLMGQQALLDMSYAQWKSSDKTQALSTVDRFLKLHPSSPAFDYGLYLKGMIHFNDNLGLLGLVAGQELSERDQRASRDAFLAFGQLVRQFPSSRYAPEARVRMDYIVNALAEHEVHVARYYLRRGAPLAAVNRAKYAVTEFEGAPAVEEALAIMVESYDRMGLNDLRDDARRVLQRSFPKSRFLGISGSDSTRSWWKIW